MADETSQNGTKWRLRLSHDADWQEQYTGYDPSLLLPKEFDENYAMGFLTARARFADAMIPFAEELRLLSRCLQKDKELTQLFRRATYNTKVLGSYNEDGILSYLQDYMHSSTSGVVGGGIKKDKENCHEAYIDRFKEKCKEHPEQLSARGFFDYLVSHVKPQYTEAWLLYLGQTIRELQKWAESNSGLPASHKETIEAVWNAYMSSGLEASVDQLRRWADSPVAQAERRTKIQKDSGPPRGVEWVGALDTTVRIAPQADAIRRGT